MHQKFLLSIDHSCNGNISLSQHAPHVEKYFISLSFVCSNKFFVHMQKHWISASEKIKKSLTKHSITNKIKIQNNVNLVVFTYHPENCTGWLADGVR